MDEAGLTVLSALTTAAPSVCSQANPTVCLAGGGAAGGGSGGGQDYGRDARAGGQISRILETAAPAVFFQRLEEFVRRI